MSGRAITTIMKMPSAFAGKINIDDIARVITIYRNSGRNVREYVSDTSFPGGGAYCKKVKSSSDSHPEEVIVEHDNNLYSLRTRAD